MFTRKKLIAQIEQTAHQLNCQQINFNAHNKYVRKITKNYQMIFLGVLASAFVVGWQIARNRFSVLSGLKILGKAAAMTVISYLNSNKRLGHF